MTRTLIICFLLLFALPGNHVGVAFQPEFAEPILNLTVPLGRDATFTCVVRHLGGYRVGWVKADTKAIQAIHDHVITHNPRVAVSHNDYSTWNLHIKGVQEEDRGSYMCQINTDPMQSQMGHLDVVVPPDIVNEDTSGDVMVPEGGTVKLTCRARGYPTPHVQWRREDNAEIVIREASGVKTKVSNFQGEFLKLTKVTRSEMGAYLCIASNGIPPSVSKRIMVSVHFHPVIQVPNQLVGAPLGTDVTLECHVEASPRSINYWVRDTGTIFFESRRGEKCDTYISQRIRTHSIKFFNRKQLIFVYFTSFGTNQISAFDSISGNHVYADRLDNTAHPHIHTHHDTKIKCPQSVPEERKTTPLLIVVP
ncbi:Hypothetical predicted protein [Cloeon dipterum]|uniref:Ig-like domain-containing protein n=1 Tax=Cloeon dipterum TaxID=197152 RepID=A0A8S1BVI5_9INSE|nr:Hypothetical predicted protein [Cloeon dipterum]